MIDLAAFQVTSLAALALSALPTISPLSFPGELIWIFKSEWFRVYNDDPYAAGLIGGD